MSARHFSWARKGSGALLISLPLSCGTAGSTSTRIDGSAATLPSLPADAFAVTVTRATEAEARAAAVASLLDRHFGEPAPGDAQRAVLTKHMTVDALGANGEGTTVRAWLDEARLRDDVAALASAPGTTPAPETPFRTNAQVIAAARVLDEATERAAWCAWLVRQGGNACAEDERVERMRAALAEAAQSLTLRQVPSEGTPYPIGKNAYRPLIVEAIAGSADAPAKWADLPLRIETTEDLLAATDGVTNDRGVWENPWRRTLKATDVLAVVVDGAALLGERHAGLFRPAALFVKLRPLTWRTARVLLALKSPGHMGDPLVEHARSQTLELLAQQLPGTAIASGTPQAAGAADVLPPTHDVLVNADIDWSFASALGGRSVWYEARARLEGLNGWTLEPLLSVQPVVQEAGIGDKHAAKQAVH